MDANLKDPAESEPQPEPLSRREARRLHRQERRAGRAGGAWVGGAILIVLGLVILLQNLGALSLDNWWALFILIPAISALGAAWRSYQDAGGRLTAAARGSLITGLVLVMVASVFLFGLDWGILGPVLLIMAGLGLLANVLLPA